jgi:hypothetical protein
MPTSKWLSSRSARLSLLFLTWAAMGCLDRPVVDAPMPTPERAGLPGTRKSAVQAGSPASAAPRSNTASAQIAAAGSGAPESAAAAGCRSPESSTAAPSSDSSYGWTVVRGKPIGHGTRSAEELRKPLKVRVSGESDYEITAAYATRSSLTSIGTDVIVEIVNRGDALHCFVQANPIGYKDQQGTQIKAVSGLSYATGAIGVDGTDAHTDTCLGPDETGYFLEIELMTKGELSLFDHVAEVDLTLMHQDFDYARPKFRFSAVSYVVDKETLSVKLRNEGPDSVPVDETANFRYLLLDAKDQPLSWGFLDVQNKGPAAAGETITATTDAVYYDGSADHLAVAVELGAN